MSCVWLDYMVKYFQCKNCVGSSPKTKKCVASFLVPGDIKGQWKRYCPRTPRFYRGARRFYGRNFYKRFCRCEKGIFPFLQWAELSHNRIQATERMDKNKSMRFFIPTERRKNHGFTWGMRVFCAALIVNVKAFAVSTADVYSQTAKRWINVDGWLEPFAYKHCPANQSNCPSAPANKSISA